jgi:hypothetical protein
MTKTRMITVPGVMLCALLSAGCGGGSGGGSSFAPIPGATPTPSGAALNFSGLSSAPLAVGDARKFTPSESGYAGSYTVTSSAPGVVAVSPASGAGPFTATGMTPGAATVTVTDQNGRASTVPLNVGSIGFGSLSSAPLATGEQRQFSPSEPSYGGSFTVTSSDPTVISATPASGAGPFTLTGLRAGTSTITVGDGNGRQATLALTVAGGASASPSPVPTSGPTSGPTSAPTSGPTAAPTSTPTAGPTTAPTPSPAPASIVVAPSSLNLNWGQVAPLTVSDSAGGTMLAPTVADPSIATIVSTGAGTYQVSANAPGGTSISFTDSLGSTTLLPVTVPASPAPAIDLHAVGIVNGRAGIGAGVVTLSPTETGYSGAFTATVTSNGVASVASLGNTFLVTNASQGSAILTVRDANGNSASIGYTAQ